MELIILVLANVLIVSAVLNYYLYNQLKKAPKKQSMELKEFIGDLATGPGLVKFTRVDPSSVFVHAPEDR